MTVDLDALVADVRRLAEAEYGMACPFHLMPCARCGSPVWQQPCPVCDFYPFGYEPPEPQPVDRDGYIAACERHGEGNIVVWYFNRNKKTVAYQSGLRGTGLYVNQPTAEEEARNAEYLRATDRLIEKARAMRVPSAGEIWDAFQCQQLAYQHADETPP